MRENVPKGRPDSDEYLSGKAAASDSILREARDAGVRLVRCLWADLSNVIRGRAIHVDALRQHMVNGVGLPASSMGLTITDAQSAPGLRGQVRLLPDPRTFRVVQYAPNTALMLSDLYEQDMQPWSLCPRSFLRRMLADLADLGIRAQVGAELEFYFGLRASDGTFAPVDESLYSSSQGMAVAAKVINDIVGSLDDQRVPIDHYHPEAGFGQQEIVLRPADPLTVCDHILCVREAIRTIAFTHGWFASFAPKPFEAQPPSGFHLHLSLWDRNDLNLFFAAPRAGEEPDAPAEAPAMRDEARWFVGGALQHLPALAALACPSVNSYRRLQPQASVSPYVAWGYDNRNAMVRQVPLAWNEMHSSANVEFKLMDGSANPCLAIGALIAAGLDGICSRVEPPEPVRVPPQSLNTPDREALGIRPLPATLAEACDTLEHDPVLCAALGLPLLSTYLAVKRQEVRTFDGASVALEQTRHFWKF